MAPSTSGGDGLSPRSSVSTPRDVASCLGCPTCRRQHSMIQSLSSSRRSDHVETRGTRGSLLVLKAKAGNVCPRCLLGCECRQTVVNVLVDARVIPYVAAVEFYFFNHMMLVLYGLLYLL